jgi:hypothetical protein
VTVCRSAIGSLFNIAQSPEIAFAFSSNLFSKKKDRAAFAGGPSQGGNAPGKGSDSGGWVAIAHLVLQIQGPRTLTRLNFLLTFRAVAWRPFVLLPITSVGHGHRSEIAGQPLSQPVTGPIG